jgi:hypothetical protein
MDLAKRLALIVPMFALLACGGAVSRFDSGDAGDDAPNPACPAPQVVGGGGACLDVGLQCPAVVSVPTCEGNGGSSTVQCTCGNGVWECPEVGAGIDCVPPPSPCPAPASIVQGAFCSTDPTLSCQSNIPIPSCNGQPSGFVSCQCTGNQWSCEEFGGPACPVDASAPCPDPNSVFAGQGCATYGTTCGGDPQSCGSTVVYDALQCVAGVWNVVASTACDVDAGIDAQGPDGGF